MTWINKLVYGVVALNSIQIYYLTCKKYRIEYNHSELENLYHQEMSEVWSRINKLEKKSSQN